MPSSPGYVRDYKQEARTSKARGEIDGGPNTPNAKRKRARRLAIKVGLIKPKEKKDIDHKVMLSKGGSNGVSNLRAVSPSDNRSFPRNKDGSAKSNK